MKSENRFRFLGSDGAPTAEEMLEAIVAAGHSNTQARRAVLQAICQAHGQASTADILAVGRQFHPQLGQVTVYRTLEILSALGLVRKLHTDDGCHTYALATRDHGHHVICQRCRRVMEFEGCDIGQVEENVARQTGFTVAGHWLEVFGLCPECQRMEGSYGENE